MRELREIKVADLLKNRHTLGDKAGDFAIVLDRELALDGKTVWYKIQWLDNGTHGHYQLGDLRKKFKKIS